MKLFLIEMNLGNVLKNYHISEIPQTVETIEYSFFSTNPMNLRIIYIMM